MVERLAMHTAILVIWVIIDVVIYEIGMHMLSSDNTLVEYMGAINLMFLIIFNVLMLYMGISTFTKRKDNGETGSEPET